MKKILSIALIAAAGISFSACVHMAKTAEMGSVVPADQVVLTGSISFVPEPKQEIAVGIGTAKLKRSCYIMLDRNVSKNIDEDTQDCASGREMAEFENVALVKWGEPFFLLVPRNVNYVKGIHLFKDVSGGGVYSIVFPLNLKVDVASEDGFAYIGDITFVGNKKGKYAISLSDNFENYKKQYSSYLKSASGENVELKKKIVSEELLPQE